MVPTLFYVSILNAVPCHPGTYSPPNATKCLYCTKGSYQVSSRSS
jgi:hypothetical protein